MVTMKLFKQNGLWVVKTNDAAVIQAFGTDILPTAFTATASAVYVLAKIQALNPKAQVILVEEAK